MHGGGVGGGGRKVTGADREMTAGASGGGRPLREVTGAGREMTAVRLPEIGLVVLPEMFLTGYSVDARAVAGRGAEALRFMRELAARENCAVCGTAAVEENDPAASSPDLATDPQNPAASSLDPAAGSQNPAAGSLDPAAGAQNPAAGSPDPAPDPPPGGSQNPAPGVVSGCFRNRMYFVRPAGSFDKYDKRHLFSFAGEHRTFTAGRERVVVEWRGVRILLQTCYDLRFPVFARQQPAAGEDAEYDLIVYSADWPESRIGAWDILLKARAVENVCYVVGANAIHSQVVDYKGVSAQNIDLEALREFRRKFPVLKDSDRFTLHF